MACRHSVDVRVVYLFTAMTEQVGLHDSCST
jgi:hypothetical protein